MVLLYLPLKILTYGTSNSFVTPLDMAAVFDPPYGLAAAVAVKALVGTVKLPV
jgi:hypothetical protein